MSIVGRVYLERGVPVVLKVQWGLKSRGETYGGPRNVLIWRPNGEKVVRPFRGLRAAPSGDGRVSPHEGRELELMLAGEKPAGIFWADHDGTDYVEPPAVTQLREQGFAVGLRNMACFKVGRDVFALADLAGARTARQTGRALGYREVDIDAFELWVAACAGTRMEREARRVCL